MTDKQLGLKTDYRLRLTLSLFAFLPALVVRAQTTETPTTASTPATTETVTPTSTTHSGDGSEEVVQMQAFGVTGSNIKRMDQEKVLPVTVFNQESMNVRMALTPVDMLTALPQVTNVPRSESSSGGATSRGDNANINLRGIGADNTLVLLNGRRLAPHPITSGDNGFLGFSVNVNQLPTQGIERIDILRDGASSIYGSDAVAGVINYITRRDFRGSEVKLRYSFPEHGGGSAVQSTLTYGTDFAGGKGRYLMTLDAFYRDALYLRDRDFSASANHTGEVAAPFNTSSSFNGTVGTGYYPSFKPGSSSGTTTYFRPLTAGATPTLTTVAPASAANARDPSYYLNINDFTMGLPRSRRVNWFNNIEYDLTDRVTAFADISYYYASSTLIRQPLAVNSPGADLYVTLGIDNPYNPYGSRFYDLAGTPNADGSARIAGTAPRPTVLLTGVVQGVAPERVDVYSSVYRIVSGLRGKITGTWTWESAGLYTRAYATDISRNGVRESLLQAAALRSDATAYNPFGYTFKVASNTVVADQPYTNPASVQKSYQGQFRHEGFSAVGSWDVRTSGEVFDLWSGAVSVATGGEARKEQFVDKRAQFSGLNPVSSGLDPNNNDYITASPKPDSAGDRTVVSAYAETVIPLVAPKNHVPLVHSFELTSSARFEHYSDFGNTTRPKVGLNYKPIDGIMIRSSFNEGFTAPNLPTLYAPNQYTVDSLPGTTDLYRNFNGAGNSTYVMRSYTTGNPKLQPVTSIGKSIGAVVDVPGVKGLSVTADYWQLEQSNIIGSLTTAQILTSDATLLNAYVASQIAAGVPVGSIDLGSGAANYKGDPNVVRLAVTADDVADFAGTGKATAGKILSRSVAYMNLAKGFVSGWDLSANYNLPVNSLGRFSFNTDWTYIIRSYTTQDSVAGTVFRERLGADGTTRWRGSATVSWRKGSWNASLSSYYIGKYSDTSASTTAATYAALGSPSYISKVYDNNVYNYRLVVGDTVSFNAVVGYRFQATSKWLKGLSLKAGIINLADKVPPVTSGSFGYSSGVYGSFLQGRTWTMELSKQF